MKYFIVTYGCQMNISDSERIASILKSAGLLLAKDMNQAELLIVNSCSVRQSAINRIYGQLINFKKSCSNGKTILTGCVLEADKKKFKDKFDLIIDIKDLTDPKNKAIKKLIKLIKPDINEQEFKAFEYTDYFKINPQYRSDFSAYIPIMTGCNNFCSYCAVPYTRGREISRPANEIINEVERLVKKGYKEITLLGQNVNSYKSEIKNPHQSPSYLSSVIASDPSADGERGNLLRMPASPSLGGQDLNLGQAERLLRRSAPRDDKKEQNKTINFPQLLKLINDIPGNFWIRFLTSHPKDMSDGLIKTMSKCSKVCEYIHLPVQAGDDNILKKMNRRYTSAHYLKLIDKIKKAYRLRHCEESGRATRRSQSTCNKHGIATLSAYWQKARNDKSDVWHPPIAISTDIIVGFPGETKTQFANTAKIIRSVKYDMAYLAQYSPRIGTAAAKLKDNISIAEKKRRKEFLNDILRKTALANNKKCEGKNVEVLIEKIEGGVASGKTRTFKNVRIPLPVIASLGLAGRGNPVNGAINSRLLSRGVYTERSECAPRNDKKGQLLQPGNFALIKITRANAWGLEGEMIN